MGLHGNDPISFFVSSVQPQRSKCFCSFLGEQGDVSASRNVPVFCTAGRAPHVSSVTTHLDAM